MLGHWGVNVRRKSPFVLEAVALIVHFEDVDVVGQSVHQRAGEALRTESTGLLVEGEGDGFQDRTPFATLAEGVEEQIGSGA